MFAKPGFPAHLRLFSTSQRLGEKWGDKPPTPPKKNKPLTSPKNNEPLTSPKNNESLKSPKSNEPLTSSNNKLTHVSDSGTARMVSVSEKAVTARVSTAACRVRFSTDTAINLIKENGMKKGDVLGVARIAGIMASKRTPDLIPLCHPIPISHVGVDLEVDPESNSIDIKATVSCDGKTGVEMEALTAASTAALTIYDMCKAVDKGMVVDGLRVTLKDGGKSGRWEMP